MKKLTVEVGTTSEERLYIIVDPYEDEMDNEQEREVFKDLFEAIKAVMKESFMKSDNGQMIEMPPGPGSEELKRKARGEK